MRGGSWIDGVLSTKVSVDGNDSTKRLIEMINNCKFKPQLQCVFLNGIAVAGFNVVDVKELSKKTGLPLIIVIRRNPDISNIKKTLVKIGKKENPHKYYEAVFTPPKKAAILELIYTISSKNNLSNKELHKLYEKFKWILAYNIQQK